MNTPNVSHDKLTEPTRVLFIFSRTSYRNSMKIIIDKEELLRLLRFLRGEWAVSSTPFGCPQGQSKVYLRRKVGKSGGLEISKCLPDDEVEKLKDELREFLRRRYVRT